jgi:hypothetical protein
VFVKLAENYGQKAGFDLVCNFEGNNLLRKEALSGKLHFENHSF